MVLLLDIVKDNLIVSCQALKDEPLHSSFIMGRMALAAKMGGAVAIRSQGCDDINEIKKVTQLPVIGIIKKQYIDSDIYITPTIAEIDLLLTTECEMIALDATDRPRPLNHNLKHLIDYVHSKKRLVMADISTFNEGVTAYELGVDCISTTLSGYTPYSPQQKTPDFDLLSKLVNRVTVPVICEGRISTPAELKMAFDLGAHSVVVGGAITRPLQITKSFTEQLKK